MTDQSAPAVFLPDVNVLFIWFQAGYHPGFRRFIWDQLPGVSLRIPPGVRQPIAWVLISWDVWIPSGFFINHSTHLLPSLQLVTDRCALLPFLSICNWHSAGNHECCLLTLTKLTCVSHQEKLIHLGHLYWCFLARKLTGIPTWVDPIWSICLRSVRNSTGSLNPGRFEFLRNLV